MKLKPRLYALNVGRGDAFFLEFPLEYEELGNKGLNSRGLDNGSSYLVLMDGGDERLSGYTFPLSFLQEKHRQQVDLLILTHLHHDHIVGLLSVAKQVKVTEAILPYPKFSVGVGAVNSVGEGDDWQPAHPKAKQSLEVWQLYNKLYQLLEQQQTLIHVRPPFGEQTIWPIGEWQLRHLAPVAGDELPAWQIIRELQDNPLVFEERTESLLSLFDDVSNSDSSIWLLEHRETGEQLILLGGDALLPVWERVLQRETLAPAVLKVSHHGMDDAINPEMVAQVKPDWLLITNREIDHQFYFNDWHRLAASSGSQLFVTGEDSGTRWLVSELPNHPVKVK